MSLERELIENRPVLWGLAYRMLGSASDAEDVLQEAYLRVRNVEASTVREPGAFLMTVVTRLAVDELRSARRRRQEYLGPWLPEPIATDATGEEQVILQESINFGLMLALENLNPIERAVFLLRDVFGYGFAEVAGIVEKSEENCRQIASRARKRLPEAARNRSQDLKAEGELLEAFHGALRSGDFDELEALLATDVALITDGGDKAQSLPKPVLGSRAVARLLLAFVDRAPSGSRVLRRRINNDPGLVVGIESGVIAAVALEMGNREITHIRIIANPDKLGSLSRGMTF